MIPKKALSFIPEVALKLEQKENFVDALIRFYYDSLKENMTSLEHTHIQIKGLGTFRTRPVQMRETLKKYERIIETLDPEKSMRDFKVSKELNRRMDILKENLEQWEELFEKKREIKKQRYGNSE
jgi:nucleoid DNA-binding protein